MERVIVHVDMDYFYAAIEEREDPSLKGKAVVVCMYSNRGEEGGAVSTCNYTARDMGIHSAMPCRKARSINPDAVFLPVRKDFYKEVSDGIMKLLQSNADADEAFEQISIDEAFLEITESSSGNFEHAVEIGNAIKEEVKSKAGISCSVGIGPNKLIAKMASSFQKPDGITVIKPDKVRDFLSPMPVKKLWGIGRVTEEKLTEMEIGTIGELANLDVLKLVEAFGKNRGTLLKRLASGIDESPVKEKTSSDQIGRMASLKYDSRDEKIVFELMDELVNDVIGKARSRNVAFRSVTATVIYSNFKTETKSRTLNHAVYDKDTLSKNAMDTMQQFLDNSTLNFRRIGIRVGNLQERSGQKSLFDF